MTSVALPLRAAARPRAVSRSTFLDLLLFATVFTITFTKVRLDVAGAYVNVSDVTATLFVAAFAVQRIRARDWSLTHTAAVLVGFFALFLAVYLVGFFNLETAADRNQFAKGLVKYLIHFALLVSAVSYLARGTARLYWQTLAWFVAGLAANAAYGLLQLALVETTGRNLDELVLGRLGLYERGGISVFGVVGTENVYRVNALTADPNHLAVILVVPLLLLLPIYLRLERGHRLKVPLAALLGLFALAELSTLSRSGLLGIAAGLLVLAVPYRRFFRKPRFLVPLAVLGAGVAVLVAARTEFFRTVFEARTQTGGSSTRTHFEFYSLVEPALSEHPFFGLGLNTFSTYYEFLTGLTNWGPHSYYVSLLTETGIVGTAVYAAFLAYFFVRLGVLRRIGRRLAQAGDAAAARVRPLAWGLLAALVGTMAANLFYLTMKFYYFFVFAVFVFAAPAVFGRLAARRTARARPARGR